MRKSQCICYLCGIEFTVRFISRIGRSLSAALKEKRHPLLPPPAFRQHAVRRKFRRRRIDRHMFSRACERHKSQCIRKRSRVKIHFTPSCRVTIINHPMDVIERERPAKPNNSLNVINAQSKIRKEILDISPIPRDCAMTQPGPQRLIGNIPLHLQWKESPVCFINRNNTNPLRLKPLEPQ